MPRNLRQDMSRGEASSNDAGFALDRDKECVQENLPLVKAAYDALTPEEKLIVLSGNGDAHFKSQLAKSIDDIVSSSAATEESLRAALPKAFVEALFKAAPLQKYHYHATLSWGPRETFHRRDSKGISYYVWKNYVLPVILGILGHRIISHGSCAGEVLDVQGEPLRRELVGEGTMYRWHYSRTPKAYVDISRHGRVVAVHDPSHVLRRQDWSNSNYAGDVLSVEGEPLTREYFERVSRNPNGYRWYYSLEPIAYVDFNEGYVDDIYDPDHLLRTGPTFYEVLSTEVNRVQSAIANK